MRTPTRRRSQRELPAPAARAVTAGQRSHGSERGRTRRRPSFRRPLRQEGRAGPGRAAAARVDSERPENAAAAPHPTAGSGSAGDSPDPPAVYRPQSQHSRKEKSPAPSRAHITRPGRAADGAPEVLREHFRVTPAAGPAVGLNHCGAPGEGGGRRRGEPRAARGQNEPSREAGRRLCRCGTAGGGAERPQGDLRLHGQRGELGNALVKKDEG